ncbi:MAG TPA: amino acid ABC transporter permease [Burkholderiaceae bacterium]|nr:amino acid ABC transporter permease [Burkholderiaceae bacterium]
MNGLSYAWDFSVVWQYRDAFWNGLKLTVELASLTILLGSILGICFALLRGSRSRWLGIPITGVIELVRAVPPLVLLVWAYYCVPILSGFTMSGFFTAILALALYSSAFYAEIFRAGIQSIEKGHIEAAYSVGMTKGQIFRRITAPLAFQKIFPPLVSQCVLVVKNTSLVGYVAVADVLYIGQQISVQSFRPIEVLTAVAVMFLVLIVPLTVLAGMLESKYRKKYYG